MFISDSDLDLLVKYKQNSCFPPGHFYSPIVNIEDIKEREKEIWPENPLTDFDVEINGEKQLELLLEFEKYYKEVPYIKNDAQELRYSPINNFFDPIDAITLYSFIRHFNPARIIEVGSGFSSAVMLDTNEKFNNKSIKLLFIEPFPERLKTLLHPEDKDVSIIIEKRLQYVPLDTFKILKENDILFIDSTHVCKTGSDLNYLFFKVLPVLHKGVIVHFHDIFYSFEYPLKWVMEGRNWNEMYILKAFLMYNNSFKILFFNDYLFNNYHRELITAFPIPDLTSGGSIYLIKNR